MAEFSNDKEKFFVIRNCLIIVERCFEKCPNMYMWVRSIK